MLRINQTIQLVFRKKEKRFSRELRRGLILAVAIHLSLFAAFRVARPPNFDRIKPITPISVEIDLGAKKATLFPMVQMIYEPLKTAREPQYDQMTVFSLPDTFFLMSKSPLGELDFSHIEKMEYTPLMDFFDEEEDD